MNTPLNLEQVNLEQIERYVPVACGIDDSVSTDVGGEKKVSTENDVAVLTLYDNGIIRDCNIASAELLGCASNYLIWQHISNFLPQLMEVPLLNGETVNPYLKFLSRVGHHFEVVGTNGVRFFSTVFFNDVEDFGRHCLRIIFRPIDYSVI